MKSPKSILSSVILACYLIFLLQPVLAKQSRCKDLLNKNDQNFFYCTKFTVAKGHAFHTMIKARFQRDMTSARDQYAEAGYRDVDRIKIQVGAYRFQDWQALLALPNPTCQEKQDLAFTLDWPRIPIDGSTTESLVTKTERNWYHPQIYYIAIMDCHDDVHKTLGTNPFGRIVINADMKDADTESEFSYENQGALETDYFLFIVYVCFLVMFCKDRIRFDEKFDNIHSPHWYVIIGMGFQLFGIFCDLIHNMKYQSDGEGVPVFEVFGTVFDMLSECMLSLLILMLANGWFTRFKKFDFEDGAEVYGPMFVFVVMIHIVFGAFTYIDQDAYHKYHDFHGWVSYCILVAKLMLLAAFFYFYSYTANSISKQAKIFYNQFVPIGIMYLMSDPILMVSMFALPEYNRQFYFRLYDQLIHILLSGYLFYQISNNKSKFQKSAEAFDSLPSELGDTSKGQ